MKPDPFATLAAAGGALARGDCSAEELVAAALARVAALDPLLNAFVAVDAEGALAQAREADRRRRAGRVLGALDGLPIAMKDLFEIEGRVASNGSASRRGVVSGVTATVVRRLRAAGAVVLGRAQMVEFAYGGWGLNAHFGAPRNPWDMARHRIPGGSSSGSGVAVAAGLAPAALGSDTGGSIRIPAALTGATGLKTTVGLVPTEGVLPLAPSMDSIGPMTRDVADAAMLTEVLAGREYPAAAGIAGARIAVMREADFPVPLHSAMLAAIRETRQVFRALGAEMVELPFPVDLPELLRRNGQLIGAEVWATHGAAVSDAAQPIGDWVRRRIAAGAAISGAEYAAAKAHQREAAAAFGAAMRGFDAMLMPCVPMPAITLEEIEEDSPVMSAFTRPANHFGACAISLPAGFSETGLPLAAQLMAKPFEEAALFRLGRAFQSATDWHLRTPSLPVG